MPVKNGDLQNKGSKSCTFLNQNKPNKRFRILRSCAVNILTAFDNFAKRIDFVEWNHTRSPRHICQDQMSRCVFILQSPYPLYGPTILPNILTPKPMEVTATKSSGPMVGHYALRATSLKNVQGGRPPLGNLTPRPSFFSVWRPHPHTLSLTFLAKNEGVGGCNEICERGGGWGVVKLRKKRGGGSNYRGGGGSSPLYVF